MAVLVDTFKKGFKVIALLIIGLSVSCTTSDKRFNSVDVTSQNGEQNTLEMQKDETPQQFSRRVYGSETKVELIKKLNPNLDFSKPFVKPTAVVVDYAHQIKPDLKDKYSVVDKKGEVKTVELKESKVGTAQQEVLGEVTAQTQKVAIDTRPAAQPTFNFPQKKNLVASSPVAPATKKASTKEPASVATSVSSSDSEKLSGKYPYVVQVGTYKYQSNAKALLQKVNQNGFDFIIIKDTDFNPPFYIVRSKKINTYVEAKELADKVEKTLNVSGRSMIRYQKQ